MFLRLLRDSVALPFHVVVATAAIATVGIAQLGLTWLITLWVDGPIRQGDLGALRRIMIEAAVVLVIAAIALYGSRYVVASISQRMVERLRTRAFARILTLDLEGLRRFSNGDLVARFVSDAAILGDFLDGIVRRLLREAIVGTGALTMLFILNWRLAAAACTVIPLTAWMFTRMGVFIRRWGTRAQTSVGGLASVLDEQLYGFSTIKTFQSESHEHARLAARSADVRSAKLSGERWLAALICAVFLATGAGLIMLASYATGELARGSLTQGALLAFGLYAGQTIEALRRLSETHGALQTVLASAARIYELIDLPTIETDQGQISTHRLSGELTFDAVTVAYDRESPVLSNLRFSMAPHEHIALVGSTGAGKTTIARLLMRFVEPKDGCVRLDRVDIREIGLQSLRRSVCLVEQDPFIFSGSLLDNIRYGSWDAPEAVIAEAVRLAGVDRLVEAMSGGLAAEITEAGRQLSGGEKQRISLARAIVRDPAVLVLDEATSALDSETEAEIFARLEPWLAGRTVITIGHRFSTIARVPRILMLERGRIVGDGPAQDLLETCAPFRRLFGEQVTAGGLSLAV